MKRTSVNLIALFTFTFTFMLTSTPIFISGFMPGLTWAHSDIDLIPETSVDAAMVVNYRSDSYVDEGVPWYVLGAMMGGEAVPANQGFSLDEVFVTLSHVDENDVYALLKLASHQGESVEFEHAYLGYRLLSSDRVYLNLEVGRMAASFSPANLEHTDTRLVSDAPLALDVFFGRQYSDDGVRLLSGNHRGFLFGIEAWQGEAFPATSGEEGGAMDIFVQYKKHSKDITWSLGSWYMQAEADSRTDNRYDSGHSHGVVVNESPLYWFDGDTTLYGVYLDAQWQMTSQMALGVDVQWLWQEIDGAIRDETRQANLISEANGGWLETSLSYQQHRVGLRYDRLVIENDFTGVAGEALAELSHLNNQGHNPTRTTLAYRFQIQPALALRAEWQNDRSSPDREDSWLLGMVWQKNLWRHR